MSFELTTSLIAAVLVVMIALIIAHKRVPRKLKTDKYTQQWKELQAYCKDKSTWANAIIEADKLLDAALKRRRFRGKTMGERLVAAQRSFSNNDDVWFAHNLCKKILTDATVKLRETDVKDALVGFRQALRDLGALPHGESRNS
jgi:hypothetical protein